MTEDERVGGWVTVGAITGGRNVRCRLCGKDFTRNFMASITNYAEALRAAEEYAASHLSSAEHAAALSAFHGEASEPSDEEEELARIFGTEVTGDVARRRRAARSAARRTRRANP